MADITVALVSADKYFEGRTGVLVYPVGTLASGSSYKCYLPDNYSLINVVGKSGNGTFLVAVDAPHTTGGFTCVETAQTLDTTNAGRTAGYLTVVSYTAYFDADSTLIATVVM